MTPTDPDVSGWVPEFLSADEQFDRQAAPLRALSGLKVVETWTVWNLDHDQWFADVPVVIRLDRGLQLEVCWEKLDDLSITWDSIDVMVTPRAWVEWPLEWRQAAHPALAAMAGATLETVSATSFRFVTKNVADPGDVHEVWLTAGLWLVADRSDLHIFNALDENGLSTRPPSRDADHYWRRI